MTVKITVRWVVLNLNISPNSRFSSLEFATRTEAEEFLQKVRDEDPTGAYEIHEFKCGEVTL
jgi:hypothetical protein